MDKTQEKQKSKDELIAELTAEVSTLRTIISKLPGNVFWSDCAGNYLGCNLNNAKLLNTTPEHIIGKTPEQILGPEYAKKIRAIDHEVLTEGKEKSIEEHGFTVGGIPAIYLTKKTPLYSPQGEPIGVLGVSFDISDRKKIEEKLRIAKLKAEAANRAKSRFLATISHELRTPLTSVLGFASLIDQANLEGEKKKEYIKHIISSGSYLLSLINSLLDFNKLETDNVELMNLPLDLKELMENVISMLSGSAKLKNIDLRLNYDVHAPKRILGNSKILKQILINLVGNAIKFTDKGYVEISVYCLKSSLESCDLKMSVKDTGIGIPLKEQKAVFKQFYQLGGVYTRNSSLTGTGLGLAIVKKLVRLMGSHIELKSSLNKGSTFYFTATFNKTTLEDSPWLPYATSVRILVIQDNFSRTYIHTMLMNTSYEIVASKEVISTLFSAQQAMRPYDIVLIDNELKYISEDIIAHQIEDHYDLHQPLVIKLSDKTSLENLEHPIFEVILEPTALDVRAFQTHLQQVWEHWKAKAKKSQFEVLHSSNPYILLVEDNLLIQIVHKHLLEELGYTVDVAATAEKCLAMLTNNYDLLLIDIGLPDMSGFELMQKIRSSTETLTKNTPIIVLTGYSEEEERQHCLRAGANDVATKPISKATLAKLLDKYIKTKSKPLSA
jgi:two-component system, sensor histidine kinase and response regulator